MFWTSDCALVTLVKWRRSFTRTASGPHICPRLLRFCVGQLARVVGTPSTSLQSLQNHRQLIQITN